MPPLFSHGGFHPRQTTVDRTTHQLPQPCLTVRVPLPPQGDVYALSSQSHSDSPIFANSTTNPPSQQPASPAQHQHQHRHHPSPSSKQEEPEPTTQPTTPGPPHTPTQIAKAPSSPHPSPTSPATASPSNPSLSAPATQASSTSRSSSSRAPSST